MIQCDNLVSVEVINTGRDREKFLLKCLRELTLLAARFEFYIRAKHIAGVSNRLPDLLSRWDLSGKAQTEFHRITDGIVKHECTVQQKLLRFSHDW